MDYTTIKTFEDACAARKYDPLTCLPDVSKVPAHLQEYITAHTKLAIVAEAINPEGYEPDWSNWSERKYYPWPDIKTEQGGVINKAGFSFSNSNIDNSNTNTNVSSQQLQSLEFR